MKKLSCIIFLLLLSWQVSFACSCITPGPFSIKSFNESQVIFIGKVLKIDTLQKSADYPKLEVLFEVTQIFKGLPVVKQIKLYTASSSAACGLSVRKNDNWLIYAYTFQRQLSSNLCTRSQKLPFVKNQELKLLKSFSTETQNEKWVVNGVIRGEGKLVKGNPDGRWKYYSTSGALIEEGSYIKGNMDGRWIAYIDTLTIERFLKNNQYVPKDTVINKKDYANKISTITHFKDGVLHGESIRFNMASFRPWRVQNFINGKVEGLSIDYHANGLVSVAENYKDGELNGLSRAYHSNGQLLFEVNYTANTTAIFKLYDEAGKFVGNSTSPPYYDSVGKKYVFNISAN